MTPRQQNLRSLRALQNLEAGGSSARTLNLVSIWRQHRDTEEYTTSPFFKSTILNKSIIVKHRLRSGENDAFLDKRKSATKIILPIDINDFRYGARSFFVSQRGYNEILREICGSSESDNPDLQTLEILDEIPSLDPFLMSERLNKAGIFPARCYFGLSLSDSAKIFDFVRREVAPLIGISFDDIVIPLNDKTSKLAAKILSNAGDIELEPLRQGMGLDPKSFEEGIFCWKGFIYYKWTLHTLMPLIRPVSKEISTVKPKRASSPEDRAYILAARSRLTLAVDAASERVRSTLDIYDEAYGELTRHGQPTAFRDFLLSAPQLFYELGERLGAMQHIVSFWRYRFPTGHDESLDGEELADIFADFEASLNFEPASVPIP